MLLRSLLLAFVAIFLTFSAAPADAQTPDPRDYEIGARVPSRTTVINSYLRHQTATGSRDYTADLLAFRATYILKYGNFAFTPFDAILPVVDQRAFVPLSTVLGAAAPAFRQLPSDFNSTLHATGIGDLTYLPTIGYGVTQRESDHTHTYFALTTYITAPTGKYDKTSVLNVGANRWTINPLIMAGQRFLRVVTFEVMANCAFFTDNDEYRVSVPALAGRDLTLQQKPSVSGAAHLAVDLHAMFYVAGSYWVARNGRREIEIPTAVGKMTEDETGSTTVHSIRINFGLRVTPQTLVSAQWQEDLSQTGGAPMSRFFGVRVSHAFFAHPEPPPPAVRSQRP